MTDHVVTAPTLRDATDFNRDGPGECREPETRLNVRLSAEARDALDWIAKQRGITQVEAIRRAIGTEKFFLELSQKKAKILVEIPGEKHLKEVIFL